ncbi:MAG: tRNA dihydrouridine(20/20a) synthase DusA [Pseudomonadota bacterium]
MTKQTDKTISVAPMMDWTDRHCRYFHRLIAPSITLYTEMVTTGALLHGHAERFLHYDPTEKPVVLQLGGSNPDDLAESAKMGEDAGYNEVNLNCGCPSDRVQSGQFGACLMGEPELVADCIQAMREAVSIPVTVKCRIGIDDAPVEEMLDKFVSTVSRETHGVSNCNSFIIHARKAWLHGLSPKENREIPPLQHEVVENIKKNYPHLDIQLNGGIRSMEDIEKHLKTFDGVMIGREAYQNPWFLREIEQKLYGTADLLTPETIIERMIYYAEKQAELYETPLKSISRHMTGLFQGKPGARRWRQILSTEVHEKGAMPEILKRAYSEAFSA